MKNEISPTLPRPWMISIIQTLEVYQSLSISTFSLRIHIVQLQLHCRKKESTIQYGYRKYGTHARVFSQTLSHGNSKVVISLVYFIHGTSASALASTAISHRILFCARVVALSEKQVPFSLAIGNELMHQCFPKHSRMGTARMKYDKETDGDGQNRGVSMERSKAGTKKRRPDGLSLPNQNATIITQYGNIF